MYRLWRLNLYGSFIMKTMTTITLHPEFMENYCQLGVFKRVIQKKLVDIRHIQLRHFSVDKHGCVDSSPYGGGEGMVLRPEPLRDSLRSLCSPYRVILSHPAGIKWSQKEAYRLLECSHPLVFIAGRFSGIDQRFIDLYVDEMISVGDYILSGGELACLTMMDTLVRLIPGALGNDESSKFDSFSCLQPTSLEHPLYARPQIFESRKVPGVLLSGNHLSIRRWRKKMSKKQTKDLRPDLLEFK